MPWTKTINKGRKPAKSLDVLDFPKTAIKVWTREALNKIIEKFYVTVRWKEGKDYEREGFYVKVTTLHRYLREKEYKRSIYY